MAMPNAAPNTANMKTAFMGMDRSQKTKRMRGMLITNVSGIMIAILARTLQSRIRRTQGQQERA